MPPAPCTQRNRNKPTRLILRVLLILAAWTGSVSANPAFKQGRKYLDLMEDSRALEQFERALQWPKSTRGERAKILLYIGITQCNLLDKESAAESFKKALVEDPRATLPKVTSPDITALFNGVRAEQLSSAAPGPREDAAPGGAGQQRPALDEDPALSTPPRRVNWPAWTCLGLGVAASAAGITLGLLAQAEDQQAQDLTLSTPEAQQHYDTGYKQAVAAYVLFAAAGASMVTSAVLFYLGRSRDRPLSASLVPTPTGVMLQIGEYSW